MWRTCSFPNAIETCTAGGCQILACQSGFYDLDGAASTGCEYACSFNGAEVCNDRDDDCDGATDEGLTPPSSFCNPNGVCMGTSPTCSGAGGWVCNYPSSYQPGGETRCDSADNDCDGFVDEAFPTVGTSCSNGSGECRTTGVVVCNVAGDGTRCTAPPALPPSPEDCDDRDNDCDGTIDEAIDPSNIPVVTMPRPGGGVFDMFVYEASRPDASSAIGGSVNTVACSRENVLPWTNVTWAEANAACCRLNASGTCAGDGSGWRLCDAVDWEAACEGPTASCEWAYAASCSSSQPLACNGREYDHDPVTSGTQNRVAPTGSATFGMCYADWTSGDLIFDLSGNVKEWTYTAVATDIHQIRGGSYNNVEGGRTCTFDFTAGGPDFAFPTTGFRCCRY
ncbi:MAG: MopE-related protein [Sandaracinaceae bacterium]|nr:MopE-related protein [Sandaracinaceae bacterium]